LLISRIVKEGEDGEEEQAMIGYGVALLGWLE